jgi:pimeloyl-ACP methyl ester carboxylesterase
LDAYDVKECTLVAESAGALTALGAALKDPHRITRLVIVDGLYHRSVVSEDKDTFLSGLRFAYSATLDRFIDLCIPELNCEHIKRWGRQILDRASQESAIALRKVGSGMDIRDKLGGIVQPTLIIHGDRDNIVPIQQAHELHALIPGSKLSVFPGAGHVPTLTMPLKVAGEISAFLKELEPDRRT